MKMTLFCSWPVAGLALASLLLALHAQAVPAPEQILAGQGVEPEQASILMAWDEPSRTDGSLLHGLHFSARQNAPAEDLYYDDSGQVMSEGDLAWHGITPRNWAWRAVSQAAELPSANAPRKAETRPRPKSAGLPVERMALEAPDWETARLEDEQNAVGMPKGALRIGLLCALPQAIELRDSTKSLGEWRTLEDGARVWALTLESPDAEGLRLHCEWGAESGGAQVMVYPEGRPELSEGPYAGPGAFWTPTCFGDAVTIECVVPAGDGARISETPLLRIDRFAYQYRGLDSLPKAAGLCNISLPCHPDWLETGSAVGGIGSIGYDGMLWCTGTLVTDADPSATLPNFLTANHCVSTPYEADSVEIYWLYQAESCDGTIPDPATVPRTTGGAQFLVGSNADYGTDVTLLRLNETVPEGIVHAGFSTLAWPVGQRVICIHHPDGDYKRISFGAKSDHGSPTEGGEHMMPLSRFHEILWNDGTTEPGSSGSALFINTPETGQAIIGQLYGGYAACGLPEEPDYYGRFDVSWPLLEPYLGTVPAAEGEVPDEGEEEGEEEDEGEAEQTDTLLAGGILCVVADSESRTPILNATVTVSPGGALGVSHGRSGVYEFASLDAGAYSLLVSAPGFALQTENVSVPQAQYAVVQVMLEKKTPGDKLLAFAGCGVGVATGTDQAWDGLCLLAVALALALSRWAQKSLF